MTPTHHAVTQGTQEWLALRCGMLTASEMHLILTPTLKQANNDKSRSHLYELLAQRITQYVEPHYISDDMLRGHDDEIRARELYAAEYTTDGPVTQVGFITNDRWGFTIGYSPDALVGSDGQLECKSRRQKYQVQTALEIGRGVTCPIDFLLQVQTGLLVTERKWCDFISYSGGLHMVVNRVVPDPVIQEGILSASKFFELKLAEEMREYLATVERRGWRMTERVLSTFTSSEGADDE